MWDRIYASFLYKLVIFPFSFLQHNGKMKHLYTSGILEQLSQRWPGPGPDSSQHLKLGYYALVCFLFCFTFFRLDKCERQPQLLCQCSETLIVCSSTTLLKLQTLLFYFFPNSAPPNWGCGLSTGVAYTWTFTDSLFLHINGNINICIIYLNCLWEIVDSEWIVIAIEFFFVKLVCMVSDSI